jgi:hypothetical protein
MQLHEYISFDLSKKACVLCEQGIFLDKYIDFEFITSLYYISDFYIEIVVSSSDNHIIEIVPFRSSQRLEKYLRNIDLDALISA